MTLETDPVSEGQLQEPAQWQKRVLATLIDSVILYVFNLIVAAVLLSTDVTGPTQGSGSMADLWVGNIIIFLVGLAYFIFFNGSEKGQTPGKIVMKIQVRDEATGGRVAYGKAGLRYLVGVVLFALLVVPGIVDMLFPLWDPKRQTLHDKAANTLVVDLSP